jgi:putative intracellular protease/amidase
VVLSSADSLSVTQEDNGGAPATVDAGFFLNEVTVPVKRILEAGFDVEFATPNGNRAHREELGDHSFYFDIAGIYDLAALDYEEADQMLSGLSHFENPEWLADVKNSDPRQYDGIFVPGGHGPTVDLRDDTELGRILEYFHREKKPTGLLCHGTLAALSTEFNSTPDLAYQG